MAKQAPPFGPLLNMHAPDFLAPGDMQERIRQYCLRSGQNPPESHGEIVRCILESLALEYNERLVELESLLGYPLNAIYIIGGGSRNTLLNQLTADLSGRPVIAGPVEATVAGNLLVQAMGLGQIASLDELRQVMRPPLRAGTLRSAPRRALAARPCKSTAPWWAAPIKRD